MKRRVAGAVLAVVSALLLIGSPRVSAIDFYSAQPTAVAAATPPIVFREDPFGGLPQASPQPASPLPWLILGGGLVLAGVLVGVVTTRAVRR